MACGVSRYIYIYIYDHSLLIDHHQTSGGGGGGGGGVTTGENQIVMIHDSVATLTERLRVISTASQSIEDTEQNKI